MLKTRYEACASETLLSAAVDGSGSVVGIGRVPAAIEVRRRARGSGGARVVVAMLMCCCIAECFAGASTRAIVKAVGEDVAEWDAFLFHKEGAADEGLGRHDPTFRVLHKSQPLDVVRATPSSSRGFNRFQV